MRALHAAFLCGVAFLVGRQSTLAPVENPAECWRPRSSSAARRLLTFNGGKRHGKGRGGKRRGGNGQSGKRGKRGRSTPTVTLDDEEEQRRQERGAIGSGAAGRCVNDEQAASFFRAHKGEFLGCAGDERRVIAALALLSPDGNKVIIDVPAHVETILARARHWALGIGTGGRMDVSLKYSAYGPWPSPSPLVPQVGANRGFTAMAVFAAWGQLVELTLT